MQIMGPEPTRVTDGAVHTIDVWFSERTRRWIVQRLNIMGDAVGLDHRCRSRAEATACVADWLRRHPETHLTAPRDRPAPRKRIRKSSRA